jgi:signal transduction histidine kinase
MVDAQVDRLQALLGTLLDVSRLNAGKFTLDLSEVDLGALAGEVVQRFRPEADGSGTPLRLRAGPAPGTWDRQRLDQVLTNLVSNALKYGNRRPVEVEVTADVTTAVVVVRDHGIGIDSESLATVFDRFERAHNSGAIQGLGLGLWIARSLVEAHGGTLTVKSAVGAGSTFTVALPRGR